jgi:hypothetical protein
VCDKLYVFSKEFKSLLVFSVYFLLNSLLFMSPQIINSDFGLYKYFKVASSLFINSLTSSEIVLYKLNIIRLDVLVTNLIA